MHGSAASAEPSGAWGCPPGLRFPAQLAEFSRPTRAGWLIRDTRRAARARRVLWAIALLEEAAVSGQPHAGRCAPLFGSLRGARLAWLGQATPAMAVSLAGTLKNSAGTGCSTGRPSQRKRHLGERSTPTGCWRCTEPTPIQTAPQSPVSLSCRCRNDLTATCGECLGAPFMKSAGRSSRAAAKRPLWCPLIHP